MFYLRTVCLSYLRNYVLVAASYYYNSPDTLYIMVLLLYNKVHYCNNDYTHSIDRKLLQ